MQHVLLQTKQWHQLQEEADNAEYTKRMRKESKCCWKNDFKQSELRSMNLLKKYSYVIISDQLNEGQFLFDSIILYKNQIFIYTASKYSGHLLY